MVIEVRALYSDSVVKHEMRHLLDFMRNQCITKENTKPKTYFLESKPDVQSTPTKPLSLREFI